MQSRLKLLIANHRVKLAAASVIVGLLLFAGAGHVYMTPEVEQQSTEEVDNFEIELSLSDSAVVQEDNPLYETGNRIERPVYFVNFTPELTISAAISTNDDRPVTVSHRLVLQEEAIRRGSELWSRERLLASNNETLSDGEGQTNATLDIVRFARSQTEAADILSSVSTVTTQIQLVTTYETELATGEPHAGRLTITQDIESTANAYWLSGSRTDSQSERRVTRPDPVEKPPNYLLIVVLLLSGSGMIIGSGIMIQKSRAFDPDELRIEMYNEQYSEWISEGELVVDPDRQYVYVNSLGDLVDIGIDADKRVIHDRDLRAYIVVDSNLIYYFAREPTNIELWANVGNSSDTDQR